MNPFDFAQRHQQDATLVKTDDLGQNGRVVRETAHTAELTHGDIDSDRLDHESDHASRPPVLGEARFGFDGFDELLKH